jgi:phage portal protein BeeE
MGQERIPLPAQAVIPLGWPDPSNPFDFAGPLQSMGTDLEAESYASQYQRNTFLNNGKPGGVIEFDEPLPRDRFNEFVLRWREQHQGINNAARVAILEKGKWVDTSSKNTDLEFEKLRRFSLEQVMYTVGMPYAMMVTQDVNLANAQTGEKIYNRYTLNPRLATIKEALNERVLPYIGDLLSMDYDLSAPQDEAFDVFAGTSGWLGGLFTQNEARQAMGYDAVPDGDRYLWEVTGTVPPLTPSRPPRRPTGLSYQPVTGDLPDVWAKRREIIHANYKELLASRNGTH